MATVTTIPVKKTDDPQPPAPSGREMPPVQPVFPPPDHPPHIREGSFGALKWFFGGISLFFIVAMLTFANIIVWVEGVPQLHPKRLAKLEKEKREIDAAEQYALLALEPNFYPCFSCPSGKVYLYPGNVWKYGVTRKGELGRYGKENLYGQDLQYLVQFRGDYAQCLIQEKIKIYHYPLIPENLIRPDSFRLVYPPGNKQDN